MKAEKKAEKLEKFKKNLVVAGLMEPGEELVDAQSANCQEKLLGPIKQWQRGFAYFTEERLICHVGLLGALTGANINIPYKNIQKLRKCFMTFIPIGIAITYEHPGTGKVVTDKFVFTKRDKWLGFLAEKAGIAKP